MCSFFRKFHHLIQLFVYSDKCKEMKSCRSAIIKWENNIIIAPPLSHIYIHHHQSFLSRNGGGGEGPRNGSGGEEWRNDSGIT